MAGPGRQKKLWKAVEEGYRRLAFGPVGDAVRLMQAGLGGNRALELGIVNKSFDDFERQLVLDVIRARLPETVSFTDVFG